MPQRIESLWHIQRGKFVLFLKRFASKKRSFAPQVFHVLFHICTSLTLFIRHIRRTAFVGLQRDAVHTCRMPVRRYSVGHLTDFWAGHACNSFDPTNPISLPISTSSMCPRNRGKSKEERPFCLERPPRTYIFEAAIVVAVTPSLSAISLAI
jgi:hypothetical protein